MAPGAPSLKMSVRSVIILATVIEVVGSTCRALPQDRATKQSEHVLCVYQWCKWRECLRLFEPHRYFSEVAQVLALVRTAQAQSAPDAPAQAAVEDAQTRLLVRLQMVALARVSLCLF